jgi:hypothetical protein
MKKRRLGIAFPRGHGDAVSYSLIPEVNIVTPEI